MQKDKDKKIDKRTFDFALEIIEAYKFLVNKHEYVLAKQLVRSGTSIGANVHEAQAAQSKKDFIAKMAIASKEARETHYWLRLLDRAGQLEGFQNKEELISEIEAIINILTKIVKTSMEKEKKQC
jgi:four helix bundle protein